MTQAELDVTAEPSTAVDHFDVIVIGAGISGMYQLHLLRQAGRSVRVLEAGSDIGGTWFWNRYPGARLDSETYSYQYAFTKDLLEEWDWSEYFAGQPELEQYLHEVARRYDLRKDIELNARVASMDFDPDTNDWTVLTEDGKRRTAHVVITATGVLSAPIYPRIPGIDRFKGETYHTGLWPRDRQVSFEGKRVAVIGTGSTGVQAITEIGKTAGHLTVFQRTANWAVPLNNGPISTDEMSAIRARYPDMFDELQNTFSGFLHDWDPTPTTAYDDDALLERFEAAYSGHGFSKWIGLPKDIGTDVDANKKWSDFLSAKLRQRIDDPATAEKLIPTDHYYGSKRVPCETGYYETYNRDNVDLVSIRDNPIEEITETAIRTAEGDVEVDMIVYATGFEAFTGALKRIDITGLGGKKLAQTWAEGPVTYLGVQVSGFPNLFIMGGPHGKGGHGNGPRCAEKVQEWMTAFVDYIFDEQIARVEADPAAEAAWSEEVQERALVGLMSTAKSIFFGDNLVDENDPSTKPRKRVYVAYVGALSEYVNRLQDLAKNGYPGFVITK
ncbi:steroid monooxygenase (plasmid) [Mycolicibacterium madagascariense]|uniref:Steroid monooxygenase n=1 Tax=Mycolicibacterium madagascariense TaxID=212765 RepID=A0A7I7XQB5_9MYCO|nr:NAD(P)/FAD-dependent oxidoreductase [Mycolicibacterium madagascariense]BBZ31232.1 steroid monooxygenase [Mycolicibacterium madagascariense]